MNKILVVFRWIARFSGLVVAGAFTILFFGEVLTPHSGGPSTFLEWAGIILMFLACTAMLAAWRWEFAGGLVSVTALGIIALVIRGNHTFHRVILTMAVPGILYMLHWLARNKYQHGSAAGHAAA